MQVFAAVHRHRFAFLLLFALCWGTPARSPAATYHVDPGGDDGAAGTADHPWRTLQHAADLALPGDTVLAHTGTYFESVTVTRSGSREAPIEFRGAGATLVNPQPGAALSAFDVAPDVAHLIISGFIATAFQEAFFLRAGARDISLRDCVAFGNRNGIWLGGATAVAIEGCVLLANTASGMRIFSESRDILVRDTSSVANDDGLGCSGDADGFVAEENTSQITFLACAASANGEDGFDLQGDQIVLSGVESRANGCAGIKLYQGARVESSLAVGNRTGIGTTSFFGRATNIEIVNVTAADNSGTQINLGRPLPGDAATDSYVVTLRNVIASGPGKAVEISRGVTLVEDHNLFFRADTTSPLIVEHFADGTQRHHTGQEINAGLWSAHSGGGAGTWAMDPELIDSAGYRVSDTSRAVDAGSSALAPPDDRGGAPRPLGIGVDIGADEIALTAENHRPWADPGPPRSIALGTNVSLSSYGSADPDGQPLTFLWDMGDGSPALNGTAVRHLFAAVGSYTVTLIASDGALSHAGTTTIDVIDLPPSPTATEVSPSITPTPLPRDSRIRPLSRPLRVRIRRHSSERLIELRLVVQNAAPAPREGYEIGIRVEPGTCPRDTVAGAPDFDRRRAGAQSTAQIGAHKRRRVALPLRFAAAAFFSPDRSTPDRCHLLVTSEQDGQEATPENNTVQVEIEVTDSNDF